MKSPGLLTGSILMLATGGTFEHAFDASGIHDYMCTIHPSMRGVVNVSP